MTPRSSLASLAAFAAGRTPRERLLFAALALSLLAWLVVTQIWHPLRDWRRDIAARIPRIERALAQMQAGPEPLVAQTPDPRAIPAVITDAADLFGLGINRLQPQGAQVQLALEDAPFETVLLWIEALQRDDGLRLVDLTLTRRPPAGVVAATLMLER